MIVASLRNSPIVLWWNPESARRSGYSSFEAWCMPLTPPWLTCASASLAEPCSGKRKAESSFIHCVMMRYTFFHITLAKQHDTKAMDIIPYEENTFYIFDRAYNDFILIRWKCGMLSGVRSDAMWHMDGQLTMSKCPEKIRRVIYLDYESGRKFISFTNVLAISSLKAAELYHNRWQIGLFFKWLK